MSHAHLRNRPRPDRPESPSSKRRKLSAVPSARQVNGVTALVNGDHTAHKITAVPTRDVKAAGNPRPLDSDAKVIENHVEHDVDADDGAFAVVDLADTSESEVNEDEDDDDDDDEDEDEEDEESKDGDGDDAVDAELMNGHSRKTALEPTLIQKLTNGDNADRAGKESEADEPSFGDILRSRGQEEVNVDETLSLSRPSTEALAPPPKGRILSVPTANSLGTVLTQALRTNDVDLLESCFQVPNLESIRATIERLHSSHATSLLQRLAERLHKRPGRAGSLMVWVQWTVVAHGGYLAGHPAAMRELQTLYQVVKQRATGLQPLLALKGKLDMLEAQMQLRRNMQARSQGGRVAGYEEGVTYVEGEDRSSSDEEGVFSVPVTSIDVQPKRKRTRTRNTGPRPVREGPVVDGTDEEDEMPISLPNGIDIDGLDDEDLDLEDSEDDESLLDDEAEETDDDGSNEASDQVDYDDNDEPADGDESEEEIERPTKRSRRP